jgi:hypothetical protein
MTMERIERMKRMRRDRRRESYRDPIRRSWAGSRHALLLCLAAAALVGTGCSGGEPGIFIVTPTSGSFETGASVQVSGLVLNIEEEAIADVRVNGVSVMPLQSMAFTTTVTLDAQAIVNPIVAEVVGNSGTVLRNRVTVIAGSSILDGDFSVDGLALRIARPGLDELEPLVAGAVDLDLATLVPPGSLVVDDYCYQDSIFGCLGRVDATISGSPPPSLSGFTLDIDPMTDFVAGDITLADLFFRVRVDAVTGIGFTCHINVSATTTTIFGDYGLGPDVLDPSSVDVSQLGLASVAFGNFSDSTDCDGFLGFIVEAFIGLVISDIQNDFVKPGLESFLNTVDANGNTPVAGAIELALDGIEISGPIGAALGVDLETPIFAVFEDSEGVTIGSDARITASLPDPTAVDLAASYHVSQPFPTFGALAPNGQPYELGICISASAFNQLLKAEVESGLLITTITEFDFGQGPAPITAGLLATLLPAFAVLDPAEPLQMDIRPTMAPFVTGQAGPAGELATLRLAHLEVSVVPVVDPTVVLARAAVDGVLGLDATFSGGDLTFVITPPAAQDLSFTLLENPLLANEATLNLLLPQLLTLAVPLIGDSLGTFPLPAFLGLQLSLIDIDRNGEFISLFLDLSPAP